MVLLQFFRDSAMQVNDLQLVSDCEFRLKRSGPQVFVVGDYDPPSIADDWYPVCIEDSQRQQFVYDSMAY
jgi:hypothetical protein